MTDTVTNGAGGGSGFELRAVLRRLAWVVVAIIIGLLALNALPGFGEVRERFGAAKWQWMALGGFLQVLSCVSFVVAFRGAHSRMVNWRASAHLGMAEQGANVLLPSGGAGGLAMGAWYLRQAGIPAEIAAARAGALFFGTSFVNFAVIAVAGLGVGIGLFEGDVVWWKTWLPGGLAVLTILIAASFPKFIPETSLDREGRIWQILQSLQHSLRAGIADVGLLLRQREWLFIFGSLGFLFFDVLALQAAFQAFGGGAPPLALFLLAYTVGQAGSLIPTPGGVGGSDGGVIGGLVVYGAQASTATASVLAYRVFQLGLPTVVGLIAMVRIQRAYSTNDTSTWTPETVPWINEEAVEAAIEHEGLGTTKSSDGTGTADATQPDESTNDGDNLVDNLSQTNDNRSVKPADD